MYVCCVCGICVLSLSPSRLSLSLSVSVCLYQTNTHHPNLVLFDVEKGSVSGEFIQKPSLFFSLLCFVFVFFFSCRSDEVDPARDQEFDSAIKESQSAFMSTWPAPVRHCHEKLGFDFELCVEAYSIFGSQPNIAQDIVISNMTNYMLTNSDATQIRVIPEPSSC